MTDPRPRHDPSGVSGPRGAEGSPGTPAPRVKICGLVRQEDARLVGEAGADWVGVVHVPGTPRFREANEARALGQAAGIPLVLVVSVEAAELASPGGEARAARRVVEAGRRAGALALQLHGDETPAFLARVREVAAALDDGPRELWKALRVRDGAGILPAARTWLGAVDLLLLDGWHPVHRGGTGATFPWEALEEIREAWPGGLALGAAGGLRPETVAEAVHRLRPHLVDVSSGVEARPGVKDPERVRAFVARARGALAPARQSSAAGDSGRAARDRSPPDGPPTPPSIPP